MKASGGYCNKNVIMSLKCNIWAWAKMKPVSRACRTTIMYSCQLWHGDVINS